jgi:ferric-dicitrate binding protein FerR (iron transport regulator)
MTTQMDWRALDRYLAGEPSDDERRNVESWLRLNPRAAVGVRALKGDGIESNRPGPAKSHAEVAFARVLERATHGVEVDSESGKNRRRHRHAWRMVLIAAVAAAAVFAAITPRRGPTFVDVVAPGTVVTSAAGRTMSVRLADGSVVILAPLSRLHPRASYGRADRAVDLVGEAHFQVVADAARPFRIHVGPTVAEVVGTTFALRAYADDPTVQLAVVSGQVRFGRRGAEGAQRVTVMPGWVARAAVRDAADTLAPPTVVRVGDLTPYVAFAEGRITFTNTRIGDAAATLTRWYGVEVRVSDSSVAGHRVDASFVDRPLGDVLDALAAAVGARVVPEGAAWVITR